MDDYVSKQDQSTYEKKLANKVHAQKIYEISHYKKTCPTLKFLLETSENAKDFSVVAESKKLRESVSLVDGQQQPSCYQQTSSTNKVDLTTLNAQLSDMNRIKSIMPLRAADFVAGRNDHMLILKKMGIHLSTMLDGRVQLVHKANEAESIEHSEMGIFFMTEMLELSKQQNFQLKSSIHDEYTSMSVVLLSSSLSKQLTYVAGPAQFGVQLRSNYGVFGRLLLANPVDGCSPFKLPGNLSHIYDRILVVKRGNCMFIEKVRFAEKAGALGVIVIDNADDSSHTTSPFFAMSGRIIKRTYFKENSFIPEVFFFKFSPQNKQLSPKQYILIPEEKLSLINLFTLSNC